MVYLAVAGIISLVLAVALWLSRPKPAGGPSPLERIAGRLIEIERAKHYWYEGHSAGSTHVLTPEDLGPYLSPGFWKNPVNGERYLINAQGATPEAELTRATENFAKGTILRVGDDGKLGKSEPAP